MATGIGGEVGWWCPSLDDTGNGTTTLYDLSGNSNDGTLTSMDAATDWVADTANGGIRALDFDGVDDRVQIGVPSFAGNGTLTVSAWVYPRSTDRLAIVGKAASAAADFGLVWSFGSNSKFSFWSWSGGPDITSASTYSLNQWYHVLATRTDGATGNDSYLYVDGSLVASTTSGTASNGGGVLSLSLGQFGSFTGYRSSSRIDDARVFERVVSSGEITTLASRRGYEPATGLSIPIAAYHYNHNVGSKL